MQTLSWELTTRLSSRRPTRVIALRGPQYLLPPFLVYSALAMIWGRLTGQVALVHLGDPVLSPLAVIAKVLKVPVGMTLHGLDVTFSSPPYRWWLRAFLGRCDFYVSISEAVRRLAIAHGVSPARISVIGLGVVPPSISLTARDPVLLLFVGRLVLRKGLEWFVKVVLPSVANSVPHVRLAVVGAGAERHAIERAAIRAGVDQRIEWLGQLPEAEKWRWFSRAAVCVVPNIKVPDDIEGYGIVALEAAASGCPLVVADIDGLPDAVGGGQGGRLVPSGSATQWVTAVVELLADPAKAAQSGEHARDWARSARDWDSVCDRYEAVFDSALAERMP